MNNPTQTLSPPKKRTQFLTLSMKPNYPNIKVQYTKDIYRLTYLMNTDEKILDKTLSS